MPHARSDAALVLGSLYGALTPPDPGVDGDSVRRWSLRTADGQQLVLDDGAHSVHLENRDGSAIDLAPDGVRITAKTDLTIDAAGRVHRQPVQLGLQSDRAMEISNGIDAGQLVATSSLNDLAEGDIVTPQVETRVALAR